MLAHLRKYLLLFWCVLCITCCVSNFRRLCYNVLCVTCYRRLCYIAWRRILADILHRYQASRASRLLTSYPAAVSVSLLEYVLPQSQIYLSVFSLKLLLKMDFRDSPKIRMFLLGTIGWGKSDEFSAGKIYWKSFTSGTASLLPSWIALEKDLDNLTQRAQDCWSHQKIWQACCIFLFCQLACF